MSALRSGEHQAILDLAYDLHSCDSTSEIGARARDYFAAAIPYSAFVMGTVNMMTGKFAIVDDPPGAMYPEAGMGLYRHVDQHPVCTWHLAGNDTTAIRLSEMIALGPWLRTDVYNACHRVMGVRFELASLLGLRGPVMEFAVLLRDGADFTDHDATLMTAAQSVLRLATGRQREVAERERRIACLGAALARHHQVMVVIDNTGRVRALDADARDVLDRWFGDEHGSDARVAAMLLAGADRPHPVAASETLILQVREDGSATFGDRVLILEERARSAPDAARFAARFPISERQAEVLALIVAGASNQAIAADLHISEHTVKRHVEKLLRALEVRTRHAAAMLALRDAPPG